MRLLFLLALAACSPSQAGPRFDLEQVRLVKCGERLGSGSYIGSGRFLTAWHVAQGGACVVDGKSAPVLLHSASGDYAVLTVKRRRGLKVSCAGFHLGRWYMSAGYAGGEDFTFHGYRFTGNYGSIRASEGNVQIDGLSVFAGISFPGMSGGPVFDQEGRVVGLLNGGNTLASFSVFRPLSETALCGRG